VLATWLVVCFAVALRIFRWRWRRSEPMSG